MATFQNFATPRAVTCRDRKSGCPDELTVDLHYCDEVCIPLPDDNGIIHGQVFGLQASSPSDEGIRTLTFTRVLRGLVFPEKINTPG